MSYTKEMLNTLHTLYTGDNARLSVIAQEVGKSVPSVRAKLVQLGLYKKPATTAVKKSDGNKLLIAQKIVKLCGLADFHAEGLAKANKVPLEHILNKLKEEKE